MWLHDRRFRLVDSDARDLVTPALDKYKQIRHAELADLLKRRAQKYASGDTSLRDMRLSSNFEARRVLYHIAIAIKMTLQDCQLVVLYGKLEAARKRPAPTKPTWLPARTTGTGDIRELSLRMSFSFTISLVLMHFRKPPQAAPRHPGTKSRTGHTSSSNTAAFCHCSNATSPLLTPSCPIAWM
jgi:hypothetical protein